MSLRVAGEPCLVVGGGAVALRRARDLQRAGARVRVISPRIIPPLRRLEIEVEARPFRARDVRGAFLVIAATDEEGVNRDVHSACRLHGVPINVVDRPDLCTFVVPSVIRRGAVTVAISTGGESPALAKALRQGLEALLPRSLARLALRIGAARRRIMRLLRPSPARSRLLKGLVRGRLVVGEAKTR